MPENEVKDTRPSPLEKYRERFADRQFESDEDYHTALAEQFDELDGYRSRNVDANKKLAEVFEDNPDLLAVVRDMINGASFTEALSANVDLDDLTPMEGEPDYEKWAQNVAARKGKMEERSRLAEELDANQAASIAEIEAFAEENGLDEEGVKELLGIVDGLIADMSRGKITKDFLNSMRKALSYKMDVANAEEVGRINGRNERIETLKDKEKATGDGLPAIGGAGAGASKPTGKASALSALGIEEGDNPLAKLKLK